MSGDGGLGETADFVGLDALGADVESLGRAVHDRPDVLDVGIPAPAGSAVRVRDVVPEAGRLSTDVTYRGHSAGQATKSATHPGHIEARDEMRKLVGAPLYAGELWPDSPRKR